MASVSSFAAA